MVRVRNKKRYSKADCPKCKRGRMEWFGVTERGDKKMACPRCYHHISIPWKK